MPTLTDPVEQAERRVLNLREVCTRYGVARSTVYRWMAMGRFPKPIQIGPNRVGWKVDDLEEWLADRPVAGEEGRS